MLNAAGLVPPRAFLTFLHAASAADGTRRKEE
jgi:hypothetical protein